MAGLALQIGAIRSVRAAAAMLAGVLLLTGCSSTTLEAEPPDRAPQAPPAAAPPSPTPTFEPEHVEPTPGGAVDLVTQTGKARLEVTEYAWHRQGAQSGSMPPRTAYLVLTVELGCTEGSCYHNPAAFRVRGADGTSATFTGGRDGYGPILGTGTLATGASTSGVVAFDVARGPVVVDYLDEFDQVAGSVELD